MTELPVIAQSRQCGDCSLCCKLIPVRELNKVGNQWCNHCEIGNGCKIYPDRPTSCSDFECLWLAELAVPEELKPNKVNAVLAANLDGKSLIAYVDPSSPDEWQSGALGHFLYSIANAMPVLILCGDKRKMLISPELAKDGVIFVEQDLEGKTTEYKSKSSTTWDPNK